MNLGLPSPHQSRGLQIGFLKTSLGLLCDGLRGWLTRAYPSNRIHLQVALNLEDALDSLLPYGHLQNRFAVIECIGGWCCVFDNLIPHADLLSLVSCLAEEIGCVGVLATDMADIFENGALMRYGKVGFELFGAQKTAFLNHVRTIGVVHAEEGWLFEDEGEPLDFESCFRFNRRRTRDHFTSEMLASYLCHLGIDVGNQWLLTDNGVVFTVHFDQ